MPLTLSAPPGFLIQPDSVFDQEKIALGLQVIALAENSKFGAVVLEVFYSRHKNGETIPLPTSGVDGYRYSRAECRYIHEWSLTADPETGRSSAPGTIRFLWKLVDQATGVVETIVGYNNGSSETFTNDGELHVWTVGQRGLGLLELDVLNPAWNNQPDSEYALDTASRTTRMKRLNANAKRAVVEAEFFYLGEFAHNDVVPRPVSPIDGFQYAYSELKFVSSFRWTGSFADNNASAGRGTLRRLQQSMNGATGQVTSIVTYRQSSDNIPSPNHGRISVWAFGFRSGLAVSGTVDFADVDSALFFPGEKLLNNDIQQVNQNIKFAVLRPEFFPTSQAHNSTVTLKTGLDSYAYARPEQGYVFTVADTGPPSHSGNLLAWLTHIGQDTGLVRIDILHHRQGGSGGLVHDGSLAVLTLGFRQYANPGSVDPRDPVCGPTPGGVVTLEPLNLDFEQWVCGEENEGLADWWFNAELIGANSDFLQAPGLSGLFAQKLLAGDPTTSSSAFMRSIDFVVRRGQNYRWAFQLNSALAQPAFAVQIIFSNADFSQQRTIRIFDEGGSTSRLFEVILTIPKQGDVIMLTSIGERALGDISGGVITPLAFEPIYAALILGLRRTGGGAAHDVVYDSVEWENVGILPSPPGGGGGGGPVPPPGGDPGQPGGGGGNPGGGGQAGGTPPGDELPPGTGDGGGGDHGTNLP